MAEKNNPDLRERTHQRVDKMMDKAESMRDKSNEKIAHLKEKAVIMREKVDNKISENPEKSVLIAAGVGLVAGAIVTAAIMRKK